MSNGGRILHHEKNYLPNPNATLLLIGYEAAGTLGRQLQDGAKTVNIYGEQIPVQRSEDLRNAIDNASPVFGKAWTITPVAGYGGMRLDARTLMAAKNDQGAFFKLREREYEGQIKQMGLSLEKQLWGTGTASSGTLNADPGTATTFTLASASDAIGFHINESILFYDNDGNPEGYTECFMVGDDIGEMKQLASRITEACMFPVVEFNEED